MSSIPDYEPAFSEAVGEFWRLRSGQAAKQRDEGKSDAGTRGSVTGGKHLAPIEGLLHRVIIDAGVRPESIQTGSSTRLPGYFRELKNWDVVVVESGQVLLTIELKSQVGSFGNNLNNRIEEAIGQGTDYAKAVEYGLLPGLRPWFGYLMVVEDSAKSSKPVGIPQNLVVDPDPAFRQLSYVERYALAFDRMQKERILDSVSFAVAKQGSGSVTYPSPAMSFQHFAVTIHNRVREVRASR